MSDKEMFRYLAEPLCSAVPMLKNTDLDRYTSTLKVSCY